MPSALLRDELLSRGYIYRELVLDRKYKQYFSPSGDLALSKDGYYDYLFVSRIAKMISKNKTLSYQFAVKHNIATPATIQTVDSVEAENFLDEYKKVVVKPPHLGGGKGLTVNITDVDTLKKAIVKATLNGNKPLIQEQFIGEEIRFTVIGGKVRSAILRQTPRVVGDGKRTLAELIAAENKLRESLAFPTLSYPQLNAQNIPEKYLSSDEIVGDKEVREFSQATMIRNGASFYGILQQIHPSYIALVEQLAAQLNPPFVVVDLMVKEWDKSEATPGSYIFLEFNTSPSLEVYTSLRGGDKPDIIKLLADQVDKYAQLND